VNLLLRLYEPEDQTVFIDGIDIKTNGAPPFRESGGLCFTGDFFFFSAPCATTFFFGRNERRSERVEEATRIAQLLPMIQLFGAGFDTVIGERACAVRRTKAAHALAAAIIKKSADPDSR